MSVGPCASEVIRMVKEYTGLVLSGRIQCPFETCPKCTLQPTQFKQHDTRYRYFFVIEGAVVKRMTSMITRWKCPLCAQTFTLYPDFALPYKRYLLLDIIRLATRYLVEDRLAYRRVVLWNNIQIIHEIPRDGEVPGLAHTTLYRWITGLGKMYRTTAKALDCIKQKMPESNIFREVGALSVHPKKYRSQQRRELLVRCRTLLRVQDEFVRVFSSALRKISIFPKLATSCAWS